MLKIKNYKSISPQPEKEDSSHTDRNKQIVELQEQLKLKDETIRLHEQQMDKLNQNLQEIQEELSIQKNKLPDFQQSQPLLTHSPREIATSMQQLSLFVESAPASIALLDKEFKYISTSKNWLKEYKIDFDVIGKSHYDIFPERPHHWKDVHNQCLRGEIIRNKGEKLVRQDGSVQWVRWEAHPWFLNKEVEGILLMTEDITEKNAVNITPSTSNKSYASLFNSIPDMILRVDQHLKCLEVNQSFTQVFGITADQAFGKSAQELHLPNEFILKDLPLWKKVVKSYKALTYYTDISLHQKQKSYQVKVVPELNDNQTLESLLIIYSDITKLKNSENLIKSTQNKFKTLVNHLPHRVLRFDKHLKLVYDNQHTKIISAIAGFQLLDISLQKMGLVPEIQKMFEENLNKVIQGKKQVEWTYQYSEKNDDRFIMHIACPEFSGNHNLESILVIGIDITELKIAEQNSQLLNEELSQLNEELSASNEELFTKQFELQRVIEELELRNHELDNIVYKISHDIRAPLASILGLINIIKDDHNIENVLSYIKLIEGRALKLDDFIRKMLDFAKANRSKEKLEIIDFKALIEESLRDLSYMKGFDTIQPQINVDLKGEQFWGDMLKLRIIFANVISNAIKYQNFFIEDSCLQISIELDYKLLTIIFKDNGVGIAEEHLSRICEIFYRANEKADGSGLGLYIVKQTIDKLKGKLKIRSKINEGTEIKVLLPVVSSEE